MYRGIYIYIYLYIYLYIYIYIYIYINIVKSQWGSGGGASERGLRR